MAIRFKTPWQPTHPTAAAALAEMTRGRNIKVFGFGEYHSRLGDQVALTTFQRFNLQLFSSLVQQYGVRHFGFELFPDSQSRDITTLLTSNHSKKILRGMSASFRTFIGTARALHRDYPLTLHGLLPNRDALEQVEIARTRAATAIAQGQGTADEIMLRMLAGMKEKMKQTVAIINDHAIRLVDETMKRGAVLALYNGYNHIQVKTQSVDPLDAYASYVPRLHDVGLSLAEFLSVRLVAPETLLAMEQEARSTPIAEKLLATMGPGDLDASLHAPLTGVHLSQIGEQSYRLTFARAGDA